MSNKRNAKKKIYAVGTNFKFLIKRKIKAENNFPEVINKDTII